MVGSGDERGKVGQKGSGHFSWGNGEMAENGTGDDSDEERHQMDRATDSMHF